MQQATLQISAEKMPLLQSFFNVLGIKSQTKNNFINPAQAEVINSAHHPYYDWEFFMSELEYE